jgi:hypothetical protein
MGLVDGTPNLVAGWINVSGVSVFEDRVFWSQLNLDNSIRYFEEGHPDETYLLACHQQWPSAVVADKQKVYWINKHIYETESRIMVQDVGATAPAVLLTREAVERRALAGNASHLYWVEARNHVMRLEK